VNLLGSAGLYTQLKFNRDMETSSDIEGLKALVNAYGHANGATELFKVLSSLSDDRFSQYGKLAPTSKADYAFIQHMIHQLDDNGTMAVVAPH